MQRVNLSVQKARAEALFQAAKNIFLFADAGRICPADAARLAELASKISVELTEASRIVEAWAETIAPAQVKPGNEVVVFKEDGSAVQGRFSHANFP